MINSIVQHLARTTAFVSVAVFATTSHAAATADSPNFADKSDWPTDVQKTAYFKEAWPAAPLMVWARTEKTGQDTDPKDPANWLLDGKPATTAPDENTDVRFPEGSFVRIKGKANLRTRHLTIASGVSIPKSLTLTPFGNVWIQGSGLVEEMGKFTGEKHTFLRNDKADFRMRGAGLANKIMFNKAKDVSVEVIGTILSFDELSVISGDLVVGPEAEIAPGNRSIQNIYPDARLILMSGAKFHKRGNQTDSNDLVVAGELLAGTPERPLTKDCFLGLSSKSKGKDSENGRPVGGPNDYGMVVRPDGTVRVTSSDPKTARLVITWNGLSSAKFEGAGEPATQPLTVDLVLQGKISLEGVMFDHILKGGIHVTDPAAAKSWKATFGDHNEGKPEELLSKIDEPINPKLEVSMASVPKPYSEQEEDDKAKDPTLD